jgi:hypothetical protein
MASNAPGTLGSLVQETAAGQSEIQQNLNAPIQVAFPVKLGILFYGFTPALKPEDLQTALTGLDTDLKASGLVATTTVIPSSLIRPGESSDTIRKLASRFGADMVLFIQGDTQVERAGSQPGGFFDQFGNRSNWEARTVLTGLGMSVISGRFTQPVQAVGKEGPLALDRSDPSYVAGEYQLEKGAETKAIQELKTQLIQTLQAVQATSAGTTPAPASTPSPSASPSQSPSPEASASPSASPSASASPSS